MAVRQDRKKIVANLGWDLVHQLGNASTIGPCEQMATMLLNKRRGTQEEDLIKDIQFLREEMLARNPNVTKYNLFAKWVYKLGSQHLKHCFKLG